MRTCEADLAWIDGIGPMRDQACARAKGTPEEESGKGWPSFRPPPGRGRIPVRTLQDMAGKQEEEGRRGLMAEVA